MTAQAFASARYKISALVFADVNRQLMAFVDEHLSMPRWQGLRVIAADGSAVRLTVMKNGVRSMVDGVAFGLYLPGIELFLDFAMHEPLCNERQMLFEALDPLRADDLLVLDRGFPCRWLVAVLSARRIHFCIRFDIANGFKAVRQFRLSGQGEQVVTLPAPGAPDAADYECPAMPTTVRLVRVHVVMTSLLDAATIRRLKSVIEELAMNLKKFVPYRSQPRKHRPKPHRSHAYKPV